MCVETSPDYIEQRKRQVRTGTFVRHNAREMKLDQTAYIAFLVTGYVTDTNLWVNLSVDVVIRRPDCSVYAKLPAYSRKMAVTQKKTGFYWMNPGMDLSLKKDATIGDWKIEATAHDLIANTTATTTYPLMLRKHAH